MASILPIGSKWRALIRRKGHKPICETFPTKAAAEQWARKIEAQIDLGKPVQTDGATIASLIVTYRRLRDTNRPISDKSNEHYMLNHLSEDLGHHDIMRLTSDDLLGWARMRADQGAGPLTVNMELGKLGTAIHYACAAKRITPPDAIGTARPLLKHMGLIGDGNQRDRRPSEDELRRVLKRLEEKHGTRYSDPVKFAAINAMRRGEVTAIEWRHLDETKHLIGCWRKHPRKGKTWEQVPILDEAWPIIQRQDRSEERIFAVHPQTLSKYFKGVCDDLGIPDLHLHDMRHESTSRLFEEGHDIPHVALVTGHADWKNLKRYTNLKPESMSIGTHPSKQPRRGSQTSAASRRRKSEQGSSER